MNFLILPGIGDSDQSHWQTQWEQSSPNFSRVIQDDWTNPDCQQWMARLEEAILQSGPDTILVAHSLGCLLVSHWAASSSLPIKGALLVAPPDPMAEVFPVEARSFSDFPRRALNFKSMLIASANDPYAQIEFSKQCASDWDSQFICIGDAEHINGSSNLGEWVVGKAMLQQLLEQIKA
ncbi:serine hydrolase family protein [Chitinibacter fontanus]|uniref:Serine hydrolase family protein n=1 Tax=Chitinibacter fontanus TaxID=1737446 RepID=A0A7D5VBY2_9NEIS|nr:alpha/beta fold hydrolase [Chitinibacter fontanus]QLI82513.1 serine hydrolase family protein [Chitinibacter fontanus]